MSKIWGQALIRGGVISYFQKVRNIAGLVSFWPMNEVSGTTATDIVSGYSGTYGNCTLNALAGPGASMGNAPSFNGTNCVVLLPGPSINASFSPAAGTLSCWAYLNESWGTNNARSVVGFMADNNNYISIHKPSVVTNTMYFRYKAGGTDNLIANAFTTVGWNHFVVTWNTTGGVTRSYMNGVAGATTGTNGVWVGSLATAITNFGQNPANSWIGWLQAAAFYNRALTASEIASLAVAI